MSCLKNNMNDFQILNVDFHQSTISIQSFPCQDNTNKSSYIVSDADEELLILVEFKQPVDLLLIRLFALGLNDDVEDVSAPKDIHVYKINDLNKNFDDIYAINNSDKHIKL
eukprot:80350_1